MAQNTAQILGTEFKEVEAIIASCPNNLDLTNLDHLELMKVKVCEILSLDFNVDALNILSITRRLILYSRTQVPKDKKITPNWELLDP